MDVRNLISMAGQHLFQYISDNILHQCWGSPPAIGRLHWASSPMSWVVSEKDKKVYGRREKKLLRPRAPLQINEDERWLGTPSRHAWTIPQEIADNILIWRSANLSGPSTDKMVEVGLKNDIMWLRNTLLQSSFKHSGQRVVNIPHQWNRSRQCYTVSFCNNIGIYPPRASQLP